MNEQKPYRAIPIDGKGFAYFVYGWYVKCRGEYYILPLQDPDNPESSFDERWIQEEADEDNWIKVIPKTVGQQIDPKDKNNKVLYFDDIVRWNKKLWIIVWSITLSNIQMQPIDNYIEQQNNPDIKRLFGASFGIGQAQCSAYIGNIHTTPELLENSK